jgi:predicted nucleotidyltransferase
MDIEGLLKSLNAHNVRYVIIGATAFPVHGYTRATLDVDIFIEPTEENARRTWNALQDFGYDLADLTVEDLLSKKILIRQYRVETDVHPFVAGVTFDRVWANRVEGAIGETLTCFAGLRDLIAMKQAAARPKDLEDLRVLLKLRERQQREDG